MSQIIRSDCVLPFEVFLGSSVVGAITAHFFFLQDLCSPGRKAEKCVLCTKDLPEHALDAHRRRITEVVIGMMYTDLITAFALELNMDFCTSQFPSANA